MAADYAVTITVSRTQLEPKTLARRLSELVERPVDELEEILAAQTVIVARELEYGEATEVQRQLGRRDIPCEVAAHRELSGRELPLRGGGKTSTERENSTDDKEKTTEGEELEGEEIADDGGDSPGESESRSTGENAWKELFPDLEQEEPNAEADSGDAAASTKSAPESSGEPTSSDEAEEAESPGAKGGAEDLLSIAESTAERGGDSAEPEPPSQSDRSMDAPFSTADPDEAAGGDAGDSGGFDAGKIRDAFMGDKGERPPYEPDGFDDRPEHVPLVSAILSALAPGAGQIYNGRPEEAQRYGWMFFLLYPWFDSVRTAWNYGEKVRTYYAPRAEKGAGKRAVVFALKWWAVVASLGMLAGWTATQVLDHLEEQQRQREAIAVQEVRYEAQRQIGRIVEAAREASEAAAEELEEQRRAESEAEYTMDDRERARRLFILGYHYCRGGEYETCQEVMGRVTALAPQNRDAFRIQTWAGLKAQGASDAEEMPEVEGDVPSLQEFEVRLAAEGRELEDIDEEFGDWWDQTGRQEALERDSEQTEEDGAQQ